MFGIFRKKCSIAGCGLLSSSTDCHSHILPGVDDGVKTVAESLSVLEYMESCGLGELWLTPHVMEDMPNTTSSLEERFGELADAYKGPLKLYLAAEYMLDNLFQERLENRDLLTVGDGHVLVETSVWSAPYGFDDILGDILSAGFRPLLAHPERYSYMGDEDYRRLFSMGVHMQLNLPSVAGAYGTTVRKRAEWLLERGFYTAFGSDCHNLRSTRHHYSAEVIPSKTIGRLKAIPGL